MITVKSGHADNRVALWETSSEHPGGEVFIAGTAEVEVALTPKVQAALADGALVEVKAKPTPKAVAKAKPTKKAKSK